MVYDPGPAGASFIPLIVSFSKPVSSVSLNFATDDFFSTASTFTLQAFSGGLGGTSVGFATAVGTPLITFPEGLISFSSGGHPFDTLELSTVGSAPYFAVDNIAVVPAPSVEIDINDTSDKSDNITLFNPIPDAQAYTQTIPAKITNLGVTEGTFQLSVDPPGAATLSQTSVDLTGGASTEITITPQADSSAPNDVHIIAQQGGIQVGEDDMTIVSVTFSQDIRNADTPAGMVDRIPPRVGTPVNVVVTPDLSGSGQSVTLAVDGQNTNTGTVTINGNVTAPITSSGSVTISGVTQTAPTSGYTAGNAGQLLLTLQVHGQDTIQSNGFSVAAIPVNWSITFNRLVTGSRRGIVVTNFWQSDSGVLGDLDAVERSEVVEYLPGTGIFATPLGALNSGYIDATLGSVTDTHSFPTALLTGTGVQDANQAFEFRDQRTGAQDVPAPNSGFLIERNVFRDPITGALMITTSKMGMAVTALGISVTAGAGSVSETQAV